mmetsp:Transcript_23884/g.66233  ORF Transcript_23884/g.66233 Transcript_23884/m.66233 type:complete len:1100 (-) Transcript_23884:40-3339(-)
MEMEDLGGRFVIAVEDVSGIWNTIKPALQVHQVLHNMTLRNKFGNLVNVPSLPIEYVPSTDPKLLKIRPHAQNPVAWFRNPYAHIIVVSCEELTDYRVAVRSQLRSLLERERDPVLGMVEWIVLYVRPLHSDIYAKGPKRVFEKIRDDFNSKKRERCVRLDTPVMTSQGPLSGPCDGLHELEAFLKASVAASFEARQAAYEEEVRRLMSARMDPGWSFPTLFLVKDSLAIMLDAAGLLEDSLREYYELEACYLEALEDGGALTGGEFGGNSPGDDVASMLTASWLETRRSVLNYGSVNQFNFRQFLFARQSRLLMTLNRPLELMNRAIQFVQTFSLLLQRREALGNLNPNFREVWVFSACVSVGSLTYQTLYGEQPPAGSASNGALPAAVLSPPRRQTVPANGLPSRQPVTVASPPTKPAAPSTPQRSRLGTGAKDDSAIGLSSSGKRGEEEEAPSAPPAAVGGGGKAPAGVDMSSPGSFMRQLPRIRTSQTDAGEGNDTETPPGAMDTAGIWGVDPSVDWSFGLVPELSRAALEEEGQSYDPCGGSGSFTVPLPDRQYFCMLGHLFSSARAELLKLGKAVGMQNRLQDSAISSSSVAAGSPVTARLPASPSLAANSSTPSSTAATTAAAPSTPTAAATSQGKSTPKSGIQVSLASPKGGSPGSSPGPSGHARGSPNRSSPSLMQIASRLTWNNSDSKHTPQTDADTQEAEADLQTPPALAALQEPSQEELDNSSAMADGSNGGKPRGAVETTSASSAAADQEGCSSVDLPLMEEAEARSPTPITSGAAEASDMAAELELALSSSATSPQSMEALEASPGPPPSTASDVTGAAGPGGAGATALGSFLHARHDLPPWLTEWRLKLALSNQDLFEELFMQLSITAAYCYSISGRRRNATMIRSDVAALLLRTKRLKAATVLYHRQAQVYAEEGWHALLAQTVPKLATCYRALQHPAYPHWLMKLLSLPQGLSSHIDRNFYQRELELACSRVPAIEKHTLTALVAHISSPPQHSRSMLEPDSIFHQGLPGAASVMDAVGSFILSAALGKFSYLFASEPSHSDSAQGSATACPAYMQAMNRAEMGRGGATVLPLSCPEDISIP